MKSKMIMSRLTYTFCIVAIGCIFQNCKKDSGNDNNNSSGYYLSATVNGASWSSNVNSTLDNAPAVAAATTSNGISVILVLGIKAVNTDSSAVLVIFPQNITVNQQYNFDDSKYSEAVYVSEASPGSTTYYGYNTLPANGGTGTFTITAFDKTAKIVEGNFTGTFGSTTGKPAIQITNGKFRCPYTTDVNQLPKSGGLKM